MNAESNLSQYIAESKSLNDKKFGNEVKISILSSFTLEGLSETLIVKHLCQVIINITKKS